MSSRSNLVVASLSSLVSLVSLPPASVDGFHGHHILQVCKAVGLHVDQPSSEIGKVDVVALVST